MGPTSVQSQAMANEAQVAGAESNVLNTVNQEAQQIFQTTAPGLQTAETFEQALASGNPNAIAQALAPSVQQITQQTQAAKQNALATTPAGGALQLALAELPIQQAEQIGGLTAQTVAAAPTQLAELALKGTSAATGLTGAGTGAAGASIAGSQAAGELSAEQKATSMGLFSSLAETAGGLAAGA